MFAKDYQTGNFADHAGGESERFKTKGHPQVPSVSWWLVTEFSAGPSRRDLHVRGRHRRNRHGLLRLRQGGDLRSAGLR